MRARKFEIVDEVRTLLTKGVLTPEDQSPPMKCVLCDEPMTLVLNYPPVSEQEIVVSLLPGLVWERDVTCVCPCCSFADCPHNRRAHLRVLP